jgi:hypothetical protein
MSRSRLDQLEHDGIIRVLAQRFRSLGYHVEADLPGYPSPRPIFGQVPDLVATNGHCIILDVETGRTIGTFRAFQRFKAFSFAQGMTFHAAVPKELLAPAQCVAAAWNALPVKWWVI